MRAERRIEGDRLAPAIATVLRRLGAAISEVEPTREEWARAVAFLTETAQLSDARRQEMLLLSDVLGATALVDAVNARRPAGATENTALGPFYRADAPRREAGDDICLDGRGERLIVRGGVRDLSGRPVAGAVVETWQANGAGLYENQQPDDQPEHNLRGVFRTDAAGRFRWLSVMPGPYPAPADGPVGRLLAGLGRSPMRPAHLNLIVTAPGFETVVTQAFVESDAHLDADATFGVKTSLIRRFGEADPAEAAAAGLAGPCRAVEIPVVLVRAGAVR